ncbi:MULTISPECIES: bifunctional folylpolyglutamate synthase/dihydrofolate synthase [Empedobacter]|uniref:Dihydrofolate synthase/folylpolyglutamate synthase n=1 Tax=Empedobacter falsenii TaxID=343874 RepID=A0A427BGA7_9FLAO|nr:MULTISPECIES: folylpolyglutamate synthase/dihydrofolate synthase family protein [Empedobacter]MDH0658367.1 bifunctional folylpolyglutamate synthase/dihydrofolate synthase [Empedobacter sp. GD03865]RRT87009.1 bifunctional folylpolyglutamate synthase/dihydrofolate synthase [Empedobacter falsenii]RRT88091.1 bifunctional folylpolyglutamate synthase/dihydrofolate synthase [Empedobacter falsenii]
MRTYQETIDWLFSNLPMFQRVGATAFKKDLTNITELCEYLGNPQKKFKTIHIAGTNGKGSTSHMLASILQEAGYKTGLTTSPHLKDFRERMRINGVMADEEFVIDFVNKHEQKIIDQKASFFEIAIAMAFEYFAQQKVDIAIIETGLGGRLDSTNIILPELSVITNIGLDHTQFLGDTLDKIAFEKAGIIKPNTAIVIGETTAETKSVFEQVAKDRNAEIIFAEEKHFQDLPSDLKGSYQIKNKRTVLTAIEQLQKQNWAISPENIANGLLNVVKNTNLRGRWDILGQHPLIVADTAHNPHGLAEVSKQINEQAYNQLHLVLGFVNDKDVLSILNFFPKKATYYFCQPDVPRKYDIDELYKIIPEDITDKHFFDTVEKALIAAKSNATENDMIYIGGSTFVVAEVI